MALFLLDTSTLTLLERGHARVVANLQSHASDTIGITTITVEELMSGWFSLLRRATTTAQEAYASQSVADAAAFVARFHICPMTVPALDRFTQIVRMKLNVGRMDLRIAAAALELGSTVVTQNVRDFRRIVGLPVADWSV